MKNAEINFLNIVAAAVHGQEPVFEEPFEMEEILETAQRHHLLPLVCEMVNGHPAFQKVPKCEEYVQEYMRQVIRQMRQSHELLDVCEALARAGVYPLILKGLVCRKLYDNYEDFRPSGDEDLLIAMEDYPTTAEVLKKLGYRCERDDLTLEQVAEMQEVTFDGPVLHLEMHIRPMGRRNAATERMSDYFTGEVFTRKREFEEQGVRLYTLSHTDQYLFLVLHALKHFQGAGFGVRQVLDILLYQREYGDEIDWNYIRQSLKEMKAEKFLGDIIEIGNRYLGFSLPQMFNGAGSEVLLEELLFCGIFGKGNATMDAAAKMTGAALTGENSDNAFVRFVKMMFPNRKYFMELNPELREKPWLIVKLWAYRWWKFIKRNFEQGPGMTVRAMRRSRKRLGLLKKYGF